MDAKKAGLALEAWIKYSCTNYSGDGMTALDLTEDAFGAALFRELREKYTTVWGCTKCSYTTSSIGGSSKCPKCFETQGGQLKVVPKEA